MLAVLLLIVNSDSTVFGVSIPARFTGLAGKL